MANTITGRLLQEQRDEIKKVIVDNNLSKAEIALLRGQSLILKFLEEDHMKVKEMHEDFTDRTKRRGKIEKWTVPVGVSVVILFITQAVYFWFDIFPKLQNLP